ncbi:winged helix-turn-helix transcriptional regulator [Tunturiibacter empetritectus]|uniref:DNA-binding HxlR family transcriptional regulator n=1 Tax=Tunturiibacter lichenicola TaxID=2051959 RepID=A0A852VH75_9BACT|nr:winged helix-turn-helix transcriptional regulator [Edaphobacter lichenicola]NYF90409.1 DNA-binding HxlR family transcriptional regulator [Edaphobacter lichenicola]
MDDLKDEAARKPNRMQRDPNQRVGAQNVDSGYNRRASLSIDVLFQSKWRVQILCAMRPGPVRLGQLARLIPGASKKMLTQNLRKLEVDGIIVREDLSEIVLHIEYGLKDEVRDSVCALLDHLAEWGGSYLSQSRTDKE